MLIPYGLFLLVGILGSLLPFVICVVIARRRVRCDPAGSRPTSLGKWIGVLTLAWVLAGPFVLLTHGSKVWMISDGSGRTLEHRCFQLWGTTAELILPSRKTITVVHSPRGGEIVINASGEPIIIDTVQYGGIVPNDAHPIVVAPDGVHQLSLQCVDVVGDPPQALEVPKDNPIGFRIYVHKPEIH